MKILLIILISCSSAMNNSFTGQYYSRIRLYEYLDYSDATFFKFYINGPTTGANWSVIIHNDGKCSNYPADIHFDLQHQAYPLTAPNNESFPDMYITTRHDSFTRIFNRTMSNATTVQLTNPLKGTWFARALINRLSKISSSNCNITLTTWLDYRAEPALLTLTLNQPLQIVLSNNITFVYISYFTPVGNSRLNVQSEWSTKCDVNILVRINGLPSFDQYDYQTVCKDGSCSMEIDQLVAFVWIYFQISVNSSSCLENPVQGSIVIRSTECLSYSNGRNCILTYPTRRIMSNSYYEFVYIPEYSNRSMNTIIFNYSSIYSYEFIVDDSNIGGTIHLDFKTEMKAVNPLYTDINILACLSKHRARRYDTCETDYRFSIDKNSSIVRSLPYPEMAVWYLTLELGCTALNNQCQNSSVSLTFQISSSKCTREQCGTYGTCQIITSQQNIFSACTCVAGYRGYGCTDSQHNHVWRYLPSVLFLTLSNLMFIPAVGLAVYHRLYIEALVYFSNMFFSTFYHACDQEIRRFCIFKYDGLQLSDFIGSYTSFVITLISMALVPRSIKVFLFMLGLLICVTLNSRDRFNSLQVLILIILTACFTILTWIVVSIREHRLQPTLKRLLFMLPGILFAIVGIVLFIFLETDDSYWYIHSLWHICMASAILFLLPQRIKQKKERQASIETNTSNELLGAINEGTTATDNEIDTHPPNVIF